MTTFDIAIAGGGIVGVCTAWQLKKRFPDAAVVLMEKEPHPAGHQTGHNSGVVHAGVYYQPGSLKAEFCKRGAEATLRFCRDHNLPVEQCGKLLVATDELEYRRMEALEKRCEQNDIVVRRMDASALRRMEPNIIGRGALYVPATGITDYRRITGKMADLFAALGGIIRTGCEVVGIEETGSDVRVRTRSDTIQARYLVACAGLHADRVAKSTGIEIDFQIIPFRGEYYRLSGRLNDLVRHLIYPIPDPDLPFLGVHLTRMIDGSVTVGPNAVLGWKREGYGGINVSGKDIAEMLTFPGFWRVIAENLGSGISEMRDSLFKTGYLRRIRRYCPGIGLRNLLPYPAGIRAQAVQRDGTLVHDFLFAESDRTFHVCNAPSPAATSAIPISEHLCDLVSDRFDL